MYKKPTMGNKRRVTVNLPMQLLQRACSQSNGNITETLVEGLRLVEQRGAYAKAMALRGKIHLDVNIDESRERNRR